MGAIIGGIFGVLALVGLLAALAIMFHRRRRLRAEPNCLHILHRIPSTARLRLQRTYRGILFSDGRLATVPFSSCVVPPSLVIPHRGNHLPLRDYQFSYSRLSRQLLNHERQLTFFALDKERSATIPGTVRLIRQAKIL